MSRSVQNLIGFAVVLLMLPAIWLHKNPKLAVVPDIELQAGLSNTISVDNCKIELAMVICVISNRSSNPIEQRAMGATTEDKNGVRLGKWQFPSAIINPNSSSEETVVFLDGDVDVVRIYHQ